ncbi:MAG: ankyrin repeat domain-containing protein [Gammaproteobacteria bacterium]|nr:ankyrin repeat domain-containing protein [Gammaproteobacteria bacterium]
MMHALVAALCLFVLSPVPAAETYDARLLELARSGHEADAIAALRKGAKAKAKSPDGTTALHWAAVMGEENLARALLKAGADPEAVNVYRAKPLAAAAERADPAVISLLLKAGAEPEAANPDGQTALMVAARAGGVEAVSLLLEAGANINAQETLRGQTALMWAATHHRPEVIRLLLAKGADPDIRSYPTFFKRWVTAEPRAQYRPHGGMAAAHFAAREGCTACLNVLLEGGADPDIGDYKAVTPLIVALDNLHFESARALIEGGANLDQWDRWGRSPLYMAVDMNRVPEGGRPDRPSSDAITGLDIARLLLEKGADPNPRLKLFPPYRHLTNDRGCDAMLTIGTTPLVLAAKRADTDAVRLLLEHGASQELKTVTGITPVMAAAGLKSIECDIRGGRSYLDKDVQDRHVATLEVLLAHGGQVNEFEAPDMEGFYAAEEGVQATPLHGAAYWGWDKVVRLLVEHGAKIDALDSRGRSPIDSAMGRAGGHERGGLILVYQDLGDWLRETCVQQTDCTPVETDKITRRRF